ncbi:MAG: hypothetical protein JWP01_4213 [Myxococcales bacterium]|nr:hypothetical protein [Myxococcales bacterium]
MTRAIKKAKPAARASTRSAPKKTAAPKKAPPKKAAPKKAPPKKAAATKAAAGKRGQTPISQAVTAKNGAKIGAKNGAKAGRRTGATPAAGAARVPAGGGRVVEILDDEQPINALRRYLANIPGHASVQEGQVALGSAQLMLLPIAREHRGGPEVKELLDLVLSRWDAFPDQAGFHAQEFLRNAFAAVGDDPDRIALLRAHVPHDPQPELLFNIACAHAIMGDKRAMLDALREAIAGGVTAAQIRRDDDFTPFLDDDDFTELLDGASSPPIPVDIEPHIEPVRSALDALLSTLREFGEQGRLHPPASLDLVLSAERTRKVQLPNDFRALLTLADGLAVWEHEFFGTKDYRTDTELARSARRYLESSASYGATGIDECVPIANWGQPNDWLLYDPRGKIRGGEPGYVLMLNADELAIDDLVAALDRIARIAADVLGTN